MDEELAAFAAAEGRRRGWFEASSHAPDRSAAARRRDAELVDAIGAATATMVAARRSSAPDDADPVVIAWQHRIEAEPTPRPEDSVMRSFADRYAEAKDAGVPIVRTRGRSSACTRCHRRLRPGHELCRACEAAVAREAREAAEAAARATEGDDGADGGTDDREAPPEMNLVAIVVAAALCIGAAWWSLHDQRAQAPDVTKSSCVLIDEEFRPTDC